ncbi:hypothetical protein ACU6QD_08335 [Corynebacterium glucuronolyticum]
MNENETTTSDVPTPGDDATLTDDVSPQEKELNSDSQSQEENPNARGSKRAVLGDLAKERDKRQAAEAERDELKKQLDAIAEKET